MSRGRGPAFRDESTESETEFETAESHTELSSVTENEDGEPLRKKQKCNPVEEALSSYRRKHKAAWAKQLANDGNDTADVRTATKRKAICPIPPPIASSYRRPAPSAQAPKFLYSNGAIRTTRVGARRHANSVSLGDLLDSSKATLILCSTYFLADEEFLPWLPLRRYGYTGKLAEIYVCRDLNVDGFGRKAAGQMSTNKITKSDYPNAVKKAREAWEEREGSNFHSVYPPHISGVCHSKFLVIQYPAFLRVVITGANLMNIDLELGDNLFYIHDFPRVDTKVRAPLASAPMFIRVFLKHCEELNFDTAILNRIYASHDFTKATVEIIASEPKSKHPSRSGFRALQAQIEQIPRSQFPASPILESCSGSVGRLDSSWLEPFVEMALRQKEMQQHESHLRIVFPTMKSVRSCDLPEAIHSNLGCHIQWNSARQNLKDAFHHYHSTAGTSIFSHQKTLLVQDAKNPAATPIWLYTGSANFSTNAWGGSVKKAGNFELGIFVRGEQLINLVAGDDWRSVITYTRPPKRYSGEDRCWNYEGWATNK